MIVLFIDALLFTKFLRVRIDDDVTRFFLEYERNFLSDTPGDFLARFPTKRIYLVIFILELIFLYFTNKIIITWCFSSLI